MTSEPYLKAIIPTPFRVLDMELLPLSIGHLAWFEYLGLAYMTDKPVGLTDLENACIVCSHTFTGYRQLLQSKTIARELRRMGKVLDLGTVPDKMKLFNEYLDQGTEWPEFEVRDHGASTMVIGAPWLQCLRTMLMTKFHVPSAEVWDYPYRLALWDCLSYRESEGRLQIITEDASAEHMDRVAAMQAANEEIRQYMKLLGQPIPELEAPHGP